MADNESNKVDTSEIVLQNENLAEKSDPKSNENSKTKLNENSSKDSTPKSNGNLKIEGEVEGGLKVKGEISIDIAVEAGIEANKESVESPKSSQSKEKKDTNDNECTTGPGIIPSFSNLIELQNYLENITNTIKERINEAIVKGEEIIDKIKEKLSFLPDLGKVFTFLKLVTIQNKYIRLYTVNHTFLVGCLPRNSERCGQQDISERILCNICKKMMCDNRRNHGAYFNSGNQNYLELNCKQCTWCSR